MTPNKIKNSASRGWDYSINPGCQGQNVQPGDPLIELEATKSETEFNELETRLAALKIDLKRLEAEQI